MTNWSSGADERRFSVRKSNRIAIINIKDLIKNSSPRDPSSENSHQWLDAGVWRDRIAYMMDHDVIYPVILHISQTRDGRHLLYDVSVINNEGSTVATDEWLEAHGVEPGTSYVDYLLSFNENRLAYDRRFHLEQLEMARAKELEKARNTDVGSAGLAASHINNRASRNKVTQPEAKVNPKSLTPGEEGVVVNESGDPEIAAEQVEQADRDLEAVQLSDRRNDLEKKRLRKYNKRSRYSETETLFMSWQNGSAKAGEIKRFVRFGKIRYYEKTEDGCVELSKTQYDERNGLDGENTYRRAKRRIGDALDNDERSKGGVLDDSVRNRDSGRASAIPGQTIGEKLRDDTARGISSSLRNGDRSRKGYDLGRMVQ